MGIIIIRTNLRLFLIILLFSCSSNYYMQHDNFQGIYKSRPTKNEYYYILQLNSDSTFNLRIIGNYSHKTCKGTWSYKRNRGIVLKCYKYGLMETFSPAFIDKREHMVKVVNDRKLKINGIIIYKE